MAAASPVSSGDPDVDAAFSGAAPAPPTNPPIAATGDPDVDAAFKDYKTPQQKTAEKNKNPSLLDRYLGFQESQLAGATGGLASLAGGLSYLGDRLLLQKSDEEAQANKARVEQTYTYQPRTAEGQRQTAAMGEAGKMVGENVGHFYGEHLAGAATRLGASPEVVGAAGATGETVGNALQIAAGGGIDALGRPRAMLQNALEARAAARVAPTAQSAVDRAYATQSQGAAVVPPDISKASPELQKGIADTAKNGQDPNPQVLERKLQAEQFGINLRTGPATRDPAIWSDEYNADPKEAPALTNAKNAEDKQLVNALDTIRQENSPSSVQNNARQHGQTLLDQYKLYDEPIKADITAKYKTLADANGGELPVDGQSFTDAADAALKKQNKTRYLPPEIRGTLNDIRDGGNFTLNQFENLRTDLAAAARKADAANDGNASAAINLTRDALEQLPMKGPDAVKFKELADAARGAARNRFDEIAADPAYHAAVNDYKGNKYVKSGQSSQLADSFMNDHVLNAPRADVETMQNKMRNNPDAQEAIAGHTLNFLKDKAGVNTEGTGFKQNGYNQNGLKKIDDKMDLLLKPETAQKVRDLGEVARNIQMPPVGDTANVSKSGILVNAAKAATHKLASQIPGAGIARALVPERSPGSLIEQRAFDHGAALSYKNP